MNIQITALYSLLYYINMYLVIEFLIHAFILILEGLKKSTLYLGRNLVVKLSVVIPYKTLKIGHDEKTPQQNDQIDPSKFIVAMELNQLIINKSRQAQRGYSKLSVDIQLSWWQKMTRWYNDYGYYYKKNKYGMIFLGLLQKLENTEIILYTSEQKVIAEKLLEKLGLSSHFPVNRRYYRNNCTVISGNAKKLPVYIEKKNTARLVILTPNLEAECDDSNGFDKYFLQIKHPDSIQKLIEYVKLMRQVFNSNTKIEQMHDQLMYQRQRRHL